MPAAKPAPAAALRAPTWLLATTALGLFLIWSNSFVAVAYLLGVEGAPARFDWRGLTVGRFVPLLPFLAVYCFGARWRQSVTLLKAEWPRLIACGLLAVPAYSAALYYGQQHGVPAPVASITAALAPLFLVVLGAVFLGERIGLRRVAGFVVALIGLLLISRARQGTGPAYTGYSSLIALTALAPLSWSLYSMLSKPMTSRVSPILWTYLALLVGTVPLLAVLPFCGGPEMLALDGRGWLALAFLIVLCTALGFALWGWLLRHLPASTVGFAIFMNPPLTTLSKWVLAGAFPRTFTFAVHPGEWLGGALALLGMAIAVLGGGLGGRTGAGCGPGRNHRASPSRQRWWRFGRLACGQEVANDAGPTHP